MSNHNNYLHHPNQEEQLVFSLPFLCAIEGYISQRHGLLPLNQYDQDPQMSSEADPLAAPFVTEAYPAHAVPIMEDILLQETLIICIDPHTIESARFKTTLDLLS